MIKGGLDSARGGGGAGGANLSNSNNKRQSSPTKRLVNDYSHPKLERKNNLAHDKSGPLTIHRPLARDGKKSSRKKEHSSHVQTKRISSMGIYNGGANADKPVAVSKSRDPL